MQTYDSFYHVPAEAGVICQERTQPYSNARIIMYINNLPPELSTFIDAP
jgi:hypothetical protein